MTNVRCSVNTCHYWGQGDVCRASDITVKNNMATDMDDDFEEGPAGMEIGILGSSAKTSGQTCCETFKPRDRRVIPSRK
jgi:hypothetical protein